MKRYNLKGTWSFCLDKEKEGITRKYYENTFSDSINLPATVSTARKGKPSGQVNTGCLTDPYLFEGYAWYSRDVEFPVEEGKEYYLILERTRVSHVWLNGEYAGSNNSLCTSHRYRLTPYMKNKNKLTVMTDNTSYPVKGGHMTSMDTQTNWNGITGEIYIEECGKVCLTKVRIYPNAAKRLIEVKATLNGAKACTLKACVSESLESFLKAAPDTGACLKNHCTVLTPPLCGTLRCNSGNAAGMDKVFSESEYQLQEGENSFIYHLDETAKTWSEHNPKRYRLHLEQKQESSIPFEEYDFFFGLRDFKAAGNYFEINGARTFLRGKHDGMIFPLTGHAPTDTKSWLQVLGTAKKYGINHYRFHTCCPPEAAFTAADLLGIYMEPELPFWGTVTGEGEEGHDENAQQYLIQEGFRILDEFGNHPSFVMLSLGNELWGSKNRLNQILGGYKSYDSRHLYTQGSNNFQFMPCILENEDFFCGVRFSKNRLFRGSYAMCDAPQGHIQTMPPNMSYNYDKIIRPADSLEGTAAGGEITVQYGTGTKTVKMEDGEEITPKIPVVSHEIGQYAMYPNFTETAKYTGVLKAENFEVFKNRLEAKGMLPMAERFFKASGRFAAELYKAELETALRSKELAGFQLLDLQDFSGQGTALVGILDAFMENKGLISSAEWTQFCSDRVLLAELPKFVFTVGEVVNIGVKLAVFHPEPMIDPQAEITLSRGQEILVSDKKISAGEYSRGVFTLCDFTVKMPENPYPQKLEVNVRITGTKIRNSYALWVYPKAIGEPDKTIIITGSTAKAWEHLKQGRKVLLYPENLNEENSIQGTYCTDFWCYSMFRGISESVGKPVPVGTLGLLIEKDHSIFRYYPTEYYTTAQWYDIVTNSRAFRLDGYEIEPLVWSIDNFERNHKLGNIFELRAGEGKLLVCTSDLRKLRDSYPARWLEASILQYMSSEDFRPGSELSADEWRKLFK